MTEAIHSHLIKEGDQVVIRKDKNLKVVPVRRNCKLWIERAKFFLDSAIGFPYGTSFEVVGQTLVKVDRHDPDGDVDLEDEDEDQVRDNRNLCDTTENQKLTPDTIRNMRKEGVHGEEIVEKLIQNSATFNQKSEFAQQKYIKKKKKKYLPIVTVLKPNARLLLEMYYNKGPQRICNLRLDSLGQLLAWANAQADGKYLVHESCVGLVVGALMERMGGHGKIIQFFAGTAPVQQAVTSFDFPDKYLENIHAYPMERISTLQKPVRLCENAAGDNTTQSIQTEKECNQDIKLTIKEDIPDSPQQTETGENDEEMPVDDKPETGEDSENQQHRGSKRKLDELTIEERQKKREERQKQFNEARELIESADSDGLIVVSKFHPTPIVMSLIDFVAPGRPIAVFCQYKEPLMDCYMYLRNRGGIVLLKMTETWLRSYQVLPNRTHPTINMSGTGGYLLTGTTIVM